MYFRFPWQVQAPLKPQSGAARAWREGGRHQEQLLLGTCRKASQEASGKHVIVKYVRRWKVKRCRQEERVEKKGDNDLLVSLPLPHLKDHTGDLIIVRVQAVPHPGHVVTQDSPVRTQKILPLITPPKILIGHTMINLVIGCIDRLSKPLAGVWD